jgi:uncharacterized protein (TIGR02246 family)
MIEDACGQDRASIDAVVAQLENAQQHELPDAFLALFRSDAIWTTAHGKRLIGREEIAAFTHRVLPGAMKESTARYEVTHVVFARPDVAVVHVRQRPITHDGTPIDDQPEGRPLYVMARERDAWKLVAGQNTQVKEAP